MAGEWGVQSVLVPRKIGELELEFEIPTWNSNWDFTTSFTMFFFSTGRVGGQ